MGYTVVLDPERLDLYSLCLRVSAKSGADLSAVGREIASLDQVLVVLRVAGDCDQPAKSRLIDPTAA